MSKNSLKNEDVDSTLLDQITRFKLAFRNKNWLYGITTVFTHQEVIHEIIDLFNKARTFLIENNYNSLMKLLRIFMDHENTVRQIHKKGTVQTGTGGEKVLTSEEKLIIREYTIAYNLYRLQLISDLVKLLNDRYNHATSQIDINYLRAEHIILQTAQICNTYYYFFQTFFIGSNFEQQLQEKIYSEIIEIFLPIMDKTANMIAEIKHHKKLIEKIRLQIGRVKLATARPRKLPSPSRIVDLIDKINRKKYGRVILIPARPWKPS